MIIMIILMMILLILILVLILLMIMQQHIMTLTLNIITIKLTNAPKGRCQEAPRARRRRGHDEQHPPGPSTL